MTWTHGNAVCYSGYRKGQSPITGDYPSYDEVVEDLAILDRNWTYLRIYDAGHHANLVLRAVREEGFDFKVMLGASLQAEVSNPLCPWGGVYPDEKLAANKIENEAEMCRLVALAQEYENEVFAVSIGNEATVDWNDHMVPVEKMVRYARHVKQNVPQPITFCENYVPWRDKIKPLAAELDFISIHTYPIWEYKSIEDALAYTKENYYGVKQHYPLKEVIITEAGWCTTSNGRGMNAGDANEDLQAQYYAELMAWTNKEKILTCVFEAFDEPWKGSDDQSEPEKHWGLFFEDRTPKKVMAGKYADLL